MCVCERERVCVCVHEREEGREIARGRFGDDAAVLTLAPVCV